MPIAAASTVALCGVKVPRRTSLNTSITWAPLNLLVVLTARYLIQRSQSRVIG